MKRTRRSFVNFATPFALFLPTAARAQVFVERGRFTDEQLPLACQQLLNQVNTERAAASLSELRLDALACSVANEHARDMVANEFLDALPIRADSNVDRHALAIAHFGHLFVS